MVTERAEVAARQRRMRFVLFVVKATEDVGPLVEGPGDVYICGECIDLCQSILDQEQKRRGTTKQLFNKIPTPREIVADLDEYVIGQHQAKRVLAVAGSQSLQATFSRDGQSRDRNRKVEYSTRRTNWLRQNAFG